MTVSHGAAALLLAGTAFAVPTADSFKGKGTLKGESATFAHGFAVWDAKDATISIAFLAAAPSAAQRAAALKDDFPSTVGVGDTGKGAWVFLKLSFPEGAKRAESVGQCEVDFFNYAASPMQTMWLGAKQCGVSS